MMKKQQSSEEIKRKRNQRYYDWRKKNPEKAKAILLRYWEKRIELEKAKMEA